MPVVLAGVMADDVIIDTTHQDELLQATLGEPDFGQRINLRVTDKDNAAHSLNNQSRHHQRAGMVWVAGVGGGCGDGAPR